MDGGNDGSMVDDSGAGADSGVGPAAVEVAFAAGSQITWEGTGSYELVVVLSAASATAVTVDYRVAGGTAQGGGTDFTLAAGTATFPAGTTTAGILVVVASDMTPEPREDLVVILESPAGAMLGTNTTSTLSIQDDDTQAWPGADAVVTVDGSAVFGGNLSGIVSLRPGGASSPTLYAVRNNPSTLFRLEWNGTTFDSFASSGWAAGKTLLYPGGGGVPDAESLAIADPSTPFVYAACERDNAVGATSRNTLLLYDISGTTTTILATREWDLTPDLPAVAPNAGIEAATYVPDASLVARGFRDEARGVPYDPSFYPNHAGGLFLVGIEANGMIYAYALDHVAGTVARVTSFSSGHPGIMGLEFDRETGYLWAACDDGCNGEITVLRVEDNPIAAMHGRFQVRRRFTRPSSMANLNNEGIAIGLEAECVGGRKPFYWTDDGETSGHSVRRDSVPCGDFL